MKRKSKKAKRRGIKPVYAVIIIVAIVLAVYAVVHKEEEQSIESDPHYGMTQVYNGSGYMWIVPQSGVPLNDIGKDEFANDSDGNLVYTGSEYKATRGIDVSSYQGDIDWEQVYESGVRFAIIRAGGMYYGSGEIYTDDNFIKNVEGAKAAGLKVGAYFFSQAVSEDEAKAEAEATVKLLNGRKLDMPIFFDWERIGTDAARTDDLDFETMTDCAVGFCETVEQAGYDAGVYVYCDTAYNGYDLTRLQDYTIWFAGLGTYPYFYYSFDAWQYSHSGTVPGVSADCDLDMIFEKK